jgi:hypothetical protein
MVAFCGCKMGENKSDLKDKVSSSNAKIELITEQWAWCAYKLKVDSVDYIVVRDLSTQGAGIAIIKHSK